jgi:hypothetical protein
MMPVMEVGEVRMPVHEPRMAVSMPMRLPAIPVRSMLVPVMLVVNMGVFMFHRRVSMLVLVALGDVQPYPAKHEGCRRPE